MHQNMYKEDIFTMHWFELMHIVNSTSIERFNKVKDSIKLRLVSLYPAENIKEAAMAWLEDYNFLNNAGVYENGITLAIADQLLEAGGEGITITVTLRRSANGTVQWSVEDDGPGIVEGGIDRMTEPHFTTKAAGTGLGLAMVKRVVEQHGGRLEIANRPGSGARFSMTLPVEPV